MVKNKEIPPFEAFSALMLSSMLPLFLFCTVGTQTARISSLCAAELIVSVLCVTPSVIFLVRRSHNKRARDGLTAGEIIMPLPPMIMCIVLSLFAGAFLARLALFIGSFTHPGLRLFGFLAALMILCFFTARRGITAVCRTAALLLIASAVPLIAMIALTMRNMSANSMTAEGVSTAGVLSALPLCFLQFAPALALAPFQGRLRGRSVMLAAWVTAVPVLSLIFSVLTLGALGRYSSAVRFPFYTASQTLRIGEFRRLDLLFLCMRAGEIFTVLSLLLCAVREYAGRTAVKNNSVVLPLCAAAAGAAGCLVIYSDVLTGVMLRILPALAVSLLILYYMKRRVKARAAAIVLLLCVSASFMSGCDRVQLQDRMIIKGLGIDETDGGYEITVQYINNYSDGDKQENLLSSVRGASVSEALSRLRTTTGSEPFLGQNSAVIVGAETARDNLYTIVSYLADYSESRPGARFYVSEATAADILSNTENGSLIPIDHLTDISPADPEDSETFTVMGLGNELLDPGTTPSAALLTIEGGAVKLKGAAAIKDGALYEIGGDDYTAYCLLRGFKSETILTSGGVVCGVAGCRSSLRADRGVEGRLCAELDVTLSVIENPNGEDDRTVERLMEEKLENEITQSVRRVSNGCTCDIYGFKAADDEEFLRSAEPVISVNCTIAQTKALK